MSYGDKPPRGPGPTGEFPDGKMNKNDKGAIGVAIVADKDLKKVRIEFGTSVTWLAMSPAEAIGFANFILASVKGLIE